MRSLEINKMISNDPFDPDHEARFTDLAHGLLSRIFADDIASAMMDEANLIAEKTAQQNKAIVEAAYASWSPEEKRRREYLAQEETIIKVMQVKDEAFARSDYYVGQRLALLANIAVARVHQEYRQEFNLPQLDIQYREQLQKRANKEA